MADCTIKKTCRICKGRKFTKILDLGAMPLANAFLTESKLEKPEQLFPLSISFCQNCGLLSLNQVVNPAILFKNYPYLTSASSPLVEHFKNLAEEIASRFITSKNDLVVEIGSNDGSLLEIVKNRCRVLGVDPAQSVAKLARSRGVETKIAFFDKTTAKEIILSEGKAKVILANNVIAHIDSLRGVFDGIKNLLTEDGVFIFETHWVGNLLGEGGFDQIYHEHLSYFSLHAIEYLSKISGLKLLDVKLVPIHGESLRVTIGKVGSPTKNVTNFLMREKKLGLELEKTYAHFAEKVIANKRHLVALLKKLKKGKKKIAGYGAPAKGNTLLNYCRIGANILDFITDTTPTKQGLYTPGSHIPIVAPKKMRESPPDYILLLSWNYAKEILEKEKALRGKGLKFIIPVPEVKIV